MIASFNLCGIQIKQRLQQLTAVWQELKETAQFLAKIDEEEAWISEQQQLLTIPDLGDNMAAVQGLLKKHDAFETDISVHGDRCSDIFKLKLIKFNFADRRELLKSVLFVGLWVSSVCGKF